MEVLLQNIADCIDRNSLIPPKARILVAISGGPDSVLLAYALQQLGYSIGLAHVNYQARGEDSAAEEAMICQYAHDWSVPVYIHRCDLKQLTAASRDSFQVVAREIRYAFFEKIMAEHGYDHCATAHHADDRTESALMALFRGNSTDVFKTIPLQRGPYVRPLAYLAKAEIIGFLETRQLPYSLDWTNQENNYLRNRIRNEVLPLLEEINPSIRAQLSERFAWYGLQRNWVETHLATWHKACLRQDPAGHLLDWTAFVQDGQEDFLPLLIAFALEKWGIHGHTREAAMDLHRSQSGKSIETEMGTLIRTREGLQLLHPEKHVAVPVEVKRFEGEIRIDFHHQSIQLTLPALSPEQYGAHAVFYLDADRIAWPIVFRSWQQGDRMTPYGMRGQKKLSDIFIDEKYSLPEKESAIVIADQEKILGLSGFRIADSVRVLPETQNLLRIEFLQDA